MPGPLFYLKSNVMAEPLINGWALTSHMLPPASYAMVIKNSYIKIMESYLEDPEAHLMALQVPELSGGPFLNCPVEKKSRVEELLNSTQKNQRHLISLAEAIESLREILAKNATGFAMEPLYKLVPDNLRGYVELNYNLNNVPSIRFLENLLYHSSLYDRSLQGFALSLTEKDARPFRRSTPILEDDGHIIVKAQFGDTLSEAFFNSKYKPMALEAFCEMFGLRQDQQPLLKSFLTAEPLPSPEEWTGKDVRIRYFGHATVLVQTQNVSILTDPFLSYDYPTSIPRYTYKDLPEKIDFALLTHVHVDHLDFETLFQLKSKIGTLIVPKTGGGNLEDPSLKLLFQAVGFKNVIEIDELESVDFGGGQIFAVPFFGEHGDLNIHTKTGYLINAQGNKMLFVADSRNMEPNLYSHVHRYFGDIDTAFIAMEAEGAPFSWSYGYFLDKPWPKEMDRSRAVSGGTAAQALEMVKTVGCKKAYVYAMGLGAPWLSHVLGINEDPNSRRMTEPKTFIDSCRQIGIDAYNLDVKKEFFLKAKS